MTIKFNSLLVFFQKYHEVIMYLMFGVFTTLVNIVTYYVLFTFLGISNVTSTIWAQVLSILFAYITNKLWVFESKHWRLRLICYEVVSFFGFRTLSALFDIGFMWVTVDLLKIWPLGMKISSNVIVVIMNYLTSKLMVFRKE